MTMSKALQNLYKAITGEPNSKVNISKLLVDIHYAITGKEAAIKNNRTKIIDSLATNWPEGGGGGGSSDFSTTEVTVVNNTSDPISGSYVCVYDAPFSAAVTGSVFSTGSVDYNVPLYKGVCYWTITDSSVNVSVSGDVEWDSENAGLLITGDCTITIS